MTDEQAARRAWISQLAKAPAARVRALWASLEMAPDYSDLRAPEIGGVMVRGRAGAVGAPFNLGEMTVTRASVQLASGEVGHAYVQGRDKEHARIAALVDALMQTGDAPRLRKLVLETLAAEEDARRAARAQRAAATKVDFFTMARGED